MDARYLQFMFYGFLAAWIIVVLYMGTLVRRGTRLKRELEDVKRMMGSREATEQKR